MKNFSEHKTYSLPEFVFWLKLGLWTGGNLEGLGYVSPAHKTPPTSNMCGLNGIYLNESVTLEKYEAWSNTSLVLLFSVYEAYSGTYTCWEVSTNYVEDIESALFSSFNETTTKKGTTWKGYAQDSIKSKRRYSGAHNSIRTGTILQPRHKR